MNGTVTPISDESKYVAVATNSRDRISLTIMNLKDGPVFEAGMSLTPKEARALAALLTSSANEIEGK